MRFNPRFESPLWLLLLAVVAGAVAFWISQRYLLQNAVAIERKWQRRYTPVKVLVAARDLRPGRTLEAADLARREMPSIYVSSGTFMADESGRVEGNTLLQSLRAGDPLGASMLEGSSAPALAGRLRAGARAVTVPVDQVSSQAGLVRPGDRVDLMLAEERNEGAERCVVVRSLLESVLVLATGQSQRSLPAAADPLGRITSAADAPDTDYSTITLDVTPEQAQQLAVGLRVGELIPMLRGEGDDSPTGLATLGTGRLGCRPLPLAEAALAPPSGVTRPSGSELELMVGGRDPVSRARHWFPDSQF